MGYIEGFAAAISRKRADQRQGAAGKGDASKLPSFAYAWQQLNPGREDDARNADTSVWDKSFVATRSSNVQQIFYSSNNQQLKAIFKSEEGKPAYRYLYFDVPVQVYNRLEYMQRSGGSVGSEFWKLVRIKPRAHRYNYRRLVGDFQGTEGNRQILGKHAHAGMPRLGETPEYAEHTRAAMNKAESARNKRAEARSARAAPKGGGQSARAKKQARGRR